MKRLRVARIGCSESTHARQIFRSLLRQTALFEASGFTRRQRKRILIYECKLHKLILKACEVLS